MTPPALPLTVQRGRTPWRLATALLLARGIPIVAVVLVLGGGAAVLEGNAGALLWPLAALAVVVAAVVVAALPLLVRAQRSTITVTDAELVMGVRRRLTLPRAELADVVVGHVTVPPGDPAAAQLCFVHAPGGRPAVFAATCLLSWPGEDVDRVLAALDRAARPYDPARDEPLRPWWVRRFVGLALAVALALSVVIAVALG